MSAMGTLSKGDLFRALTRIDLALEQEEWDKIELIVLDLFDRYSMSPTYAMDKIMKEERATFHDRQIKDILKRDLGSD